MEQQGSFNSTELQHLELDVSTVPDRANGFPQELQSSCSSSCSFSNQERNTTDAGQRSKTTFKLCGLIVFYTVIMLVEIAGGLKANSLAILTDAAHLLSDIVGFSISLFTVWVSGWAATSRQSFGFNRLEVLGALLSVQLIWVVSGTLIYEAINRLVHKSVKVNGDLMLAVAGFGFFVNLVMVLWLGHDHSHSHSHSHHHHEDHNHKPEELCNGDKEEGTKLVASTTHDDNHEIVNINIQGAYLHLVTDLIQSVGVMIAGSIIWLKPEWLVIDLLCTLIFSTIAVCTTLPMIKNIFSILMEGVPTEVDIARLENGIKLIRGVNDVHDLHVWAITVGKNVVSCHVVIESGVSPNVILQSIREYCERTFKIHHVTVQIEDGLL